MDWNAIKNNKQLKPNTNSVQENSMKVSHMYQKSDYTTLTKPGILFKLAIPQERFYKATKQSKNQ